MGLSELLMRTYAVIPTHAGYKISRTPNFSEYQHNTKITIINSMDRPTTPPNLPQR